MTRIETFAEQHRLKVTRDECNDQVIQGRRGQLYFDGPELCLTVLDGVPAIRSKWAALGGKLWMGDISPHPKTAKRVQDVKITGIPPENAKLAIRMCRVKPKRIMSEAQKAVLDGARSLLPSPPQRQRHRVESLGGSGVMGRRRGNLPEQRKACLDALLRRNRQTHLSRLPLDRGDSGRPRHQARNPHLPTVWRRSRFSPSMPGCRFKWVGLTASYDRPLILQHTLAGLHFYEATDVRYEAAATLGG